MRQTLRILAIAAGVTLAVYAVLWLMSGLWDTPAKASALDTPQGEHDLYATTLGEFAYRLPAFCATAHGQSNLIFIGGSVARAYRPDIVGPELPGWTISDVSLDYANITEIRQAFEMMRNCLAPDGLRNTTFVLAVNMLQFTPNHHVWQTPYTVLELELLRHGLFEGEPGHVRPIMPWRWLRPVVDVMRPVLAAYGLSYRGGIELNDAYRKWEGIWHRPGADRAKEIQGLKSHFDATDLSALQEQIDELDRFVAEVRAVHAKLIILDMPIGNWLAGSLPQFTAYRDWLPGYAKRNAIPYIDLVASGSDDDYVDGFHANAVGERRWSIRAAQELRRIPEISQDRSGSQENSTADARR